MAPYFTIKKKLKAEIVVHELYPYLRVTYVGWKVLRAYWLRVTSPQFIGVTLLVIRKLEEALSMMAAHINANLNIVDRIAGGVNVDVEWNADNSLAVLRVFPRSDKYLAIIHRDELGNVYVDFPRINYSDLPSLIQARHICGQVVQVAESMRRG